METKEQTLTLAELDDALEYIRKRYEKFELMNLLGIRWSKDATCDCQNCQKYNEAVALLTKHRIQLPPEPQPMIPLEEENSTTETENPSPAPPSTTTPQQVIGLLVSFLNKD